MPPRDVSYLFLKGVGAWFPIKFPKSSHQIPLVSINNSSICFWFHQVPKQFQSNSSCSHQFLIKSLLFPSSFHQNPFIPTTSHQLHFVPSTYFCSQPNPTLNKPTQSSKFCERLGQSAKRSAPVPGQARKASYSNRQTSVWCGRAESGDFVPARFCGKPRADLFLARVLPSRTAALLPSCACAIVRNERVWYHNEFERGLKRISSAQPGAELPPAPSR
jgi:hypothetical protein